METMNRIPKQLKIMLLMLLFVGYGTTAQTADQQEIIDDSERAKQAFIEQDPGIEDLFKFLVFITS